MGVVFKKKPVVVVNSPAQARLAEGVVAAAIAALPPGGVVVGDQVNYTGTPEELQKIMESIGLVAPKEKAVVKFSVGERLRVTNPHFTWITTHKQDDEGVVLRVISPIKEALQYGDQYGLLEVRMDNGNVVFLHNWEVEHA